MNGVIGMVQLLMTTELSAEQRRYAETVESSGRALLALINDILDLSKIEAGKIVIENLEFDLRRTVADVIDLLRVQAGAKGLTFGARVSRGTAGAPARRSQPPAPGLEQPGCQRHQVHRTGRGGARCAICRRRRWQGNRSFRRHRHRDRDSPGSGRRIVFAIRSGRCIDDPQIRRHRSRVGHLQTARRKNGWEDWAREPGRGRLHLLVHSGL